MFNIRDRGEYGQKKHGLDATVAVNKNKIVSEWHLCILQVPGYIGTLLTN